MSKSLYELGLEYEEEAKNLDEKIKDCKQRLRDYQKGLIQLSTKGYSLEDLIKIYIEERDECRDKARILKKYYVKEG